MLNHTEYRRFLNSDNIYRQEFFYPHGQDKRTTRLNKILREIVLGNLTVDEKLICKFECEVPNQKYNFSISVPNRYNNPEILWEAVYHTLEKVMCWYDLSEIDNFEIKVDDGGFFSKCTYYDLAGWGLVRSSVFGIAPNYSESKKQKISEWVKVKFEKDRIEYQKQMIRGYSLLSESDETTTIDRPKGIKKVINKIKKYANFSF
jgi:hypothetical protein